MQTVNEWTYAGTTYRTGDEVRYDLYNDEHYKYSNQVATIVKLKAEFDCNINFLFLDVKFKDGAILCELDPEQFVHESGESLL